jgi:hypothetical protein
MSNEPSWLNTVILPCSLNRDLDKAVLSSWPPATSSEVEMPSTSIVGVNIVVEVSGVL